MQDPLPRVATRARSRRGYPGAGNGPVLPAGLPPNCDLGTGMRGEQKMRNNGSRAVAHRAMLCAGGGDTDAVVCRVLREEGYEVVACPGHEALLERAINDPPDVLIYSLTPRCPLDRGALQLVRRSLPKTPLIVVSSEGSLEEQRILLAFRPTYYAVAPLDEGELRDALHAALAQREKLTLGGKGTA